MYIRGCGRYDRIDRRQHSALCTLAQLRYTVLEYREVESNRMKFTIECEQEEDGRWIAEVLEIPGVLVYGRTPQDAKSKARALGLRVLADRIEQGEDTPAVMSISFAFA